MSDRDKMISEIGASLIRDISCQSCADLRAELARVVAERDELRANLDRLRGVVEMFEARGRRREGSRR